MPDIPGQPGHPSREWVRVQNLGSSRRSHLFLIQGRARALTPARSTHVHDFLGFFMPATLRRRSPRQWVCLGRLSPTGPTKTLPKVAISNNRQNSKTSNPLYTTYGNSRPRRMKKSFVKTCTSQEFTKLQTFTQPSGLQARPARRQ